MATVRPTRHEDLPALSALYAEGFGRPLLPAEWEWKYERLPGEARSLVALDGEELLAHVGAFALPARWRGEDRLCWQIVDFVGRPRGLRPPLVTAGRALFADLPRAGDLPWLLGFPSPRHLTLGQRVFDYGSPPPIPVLEGPLSVDGTVDRDGIVAVSDRSDATSEAIWSACGVDSVRRSAAFLDWRYCARPERYYRFYHLRAGDRAGLVVAAFTGELALIAEAWLPAPADWAPALRAVAGDLLASGLVRWRSWPLPPGADPGLLARLGMTTPVEEVPRGCRGPRGNGEEAVPLVCSLYYPMGDYDLV